jgi:hypothetical protein
MIISYYLSGKRCSKFREKLKSPVRTHYKFKLQFKAKQKQDKFYETKLSRLQLGYASMRSKSLPVVKDTIDAFKQSQKIMEMCKISGSDTGRA